MPATLNINGDMQQIPYRYPAFMVLSILMLVAALLIFNSCEKKAGPVPPSISLLTGEGYVSRDTVIPAGTKVKVGIHAAGGNTNLTYFSVRFNDGIETTFLDTGMNSPSLVYDMETIKTNASDEIWTFLVMDRNRIRDSVRIVFSRSAVSQWGKIRIMENVILGAQESALAGSFYSLTQNRVMNLQEAWDNQPLTDIVYYFGQYDGTLASPAENEAPGYFTGPAGIDNWTVKNLTLYDTTLITPQVFEMAHNDSLILSAYEPTAGKKKGKFVEPGMVFSFIGPAGKPGLIRIEETAPLPAGSVKLTIKIQE